MIGEFLSNQKGISLLEVIIGAGLAGGLALFLAQVVSQNNKASNVLDDKQTMRNIVEQIFARLRVEKNCSETFLGLEEGEGVINSIKINGFDKFPVDDPNSNKRLKLVRYDLSSSGSNIAEDEFVLSIMFKQRSREALHTRKITLKASPDNSQPISSCIAAAGSDSRISGLTCPTGSWLQGFDNSGGPICIDKTAIELPEPVIRSGNARDGQKIRPPREFSPSQCHLVVGTGMPGKADDGYKRSRHYGAYYEETFDGWIIRIQLRGIQDNSLRAVSTGIAQYMMVCSESSISRTAATSSPSLPSTPTTNPVTTTRTGTTTSNPIDDCARLGGRFAKGSCSFGGANTPSNSPSRSGGGIEREGLQNSER